MEFVEVGRENSTPVELHDVESEGAPHGLLGTRADEVNAALHDFLA